MQQKLHQVKDTFFDILTRIKRYPNKIRIADVTAESEVDSMIISGPKHTYFYFRFEYILSVIYSITVIATTTVFLLYDTETSSTADQPFTLLKYWLRLGIVLHICALVPKGLILRFLARIPEENEHIIVRRLMVLVRSNVFFWNDKVSFVMYNYYIFGIGKIASSNICGSIANNLFRLCHFLICCFLLRLANLFVRFVVEYYVMSHNIEYESIIDQGAVQEEIDALPIAAYSSESNAGKSDTTEQWCGICLSGFKSGDEIRTLPCSSHHFFHKRCTDTWLKRQYICPYCRKSLRFLVNQQY